VGKLINIFVSEMMELIESKHYTNNNWIVPHTKFCVNWKPKMTATAGKIQHIDTYGKNILKLFLSEMSEQFDSRISCYVPWMVFLPNVSFLCPSEIQDVSNRKTKLYHQWYPTAI
jgi:hypothetical protein